MGEKEQGGMLRTVVVLGIIAIISFVVIAAVIGLKGNMNTNTDKAVATVVKTKAPYTVTSPDVTYLDYTPKSTDPEAWTGWGDHFWVFPVVGKVPYNSWREDRLVVNSTKRTYILIDVNNSIKDGSANNDFDDSAKRSLDVYDDKGLLITTVTNFGQKTWLEANRDYTLVLHYWNHVHYWSDGSVNNPTMASLVESAADSGSRPRMGHGTADGSAYKFQVKSFEAATYDNKYLNV